MSTDSYGLNLLQPIIHSGVPATRATQSCESSEICNLGSTCSAYTQRQSILKQPRDLEIHPFILRTSRARSQIHSHRFSPNFCSTRMNQRTVEIHAWQSRSVSCAKTSFDLMLLTYSSEELVPDDVCCPAFFFENALG
jgi:hypothetical protein